MLALFSVVVAVICMRCSLVNVNDASEVTLYLAPVMLMITNMHSTELHYVRFVALDLWKHFFLSKFRF